VGGSLVGGGGGGVEKDGLRREGMNCMDCMVTDRVRCWGGRLGWDGMGIRGDADLRGSRSIG
jgi:hypothetical protein